jgi:hypothetical protein
MMYGQDGGDVKAIVREAGPDDLVDEDDV